MKKETKVEPKLLNKKVLMNRKASTLLGKDVRFKSPTTGRIKVGVVTMVGESKLRIADKRGLVSEVVWEEVFER